MIGVVLFPNILLTAATGTEEETVNESEQYLTNGRSIYKATAVREEVSAGANEGSLSGRRARRRFGETKAKHDKCLVI